MPSIDDWYDTPTKALVEDDEIVQYVADMNEREDPEEGLVPYRIRRFAKFERRRLPLDWFRPEEAEEMVSANLVRTYQEEPAETAPPIVVDGEDHAIIDGFHRYNAALARGDRDILAYVGIDPRANWEPWKEPEVSGRKRPHP